MAGDILLLKPSFYGIGLDLRELARKVRAMRDGRAADSVATRFFRLFHEHGVTREQIPRLVSGLKLKHVASDEALLDVLDNSILDEVCQLFGIERDWLDGASARMYPLRYCYKAPHLFFDEFESLTMPEPIAPVRALATAKALQRSSGVEQRIELVLVEQAAVLGDRSVYRFRPFSDGWDWRYQECRLQLKAMVRKLARPVPIYEIDIDAMAGIYAGEIVPGPMMRGALCTSPSLEDYCMSPCKNLRAKEVEELDSVVQYLSESGLDQR